MKVDVIIPVYQPGKELLTLLDKLQEQTVPVQKIILMNTEEKYFERLMYEGGFRENYSNVEVHHLSKREFDHGGTRHRGVQYSEAEIFLTMTQDAMPADELLVERLIGQLRDGVAVSYARQLPEGNADELEKFSRYFNYPPVSCLKSEKDLPSLGIKTFFCSNVCAAYRRDIYDELGGFTRHTIFNEDMIYASAAVRAGYAVAYEADARVIHSHDYTWRQQLRRNFDLGVSQTDYPEAFAGVHSEAEGKKLVSAAWRYLRKKGKLYRFPDFCVQCGFRYAGFLMGKNYRRLPRRWVLAITTNKEYWKQERRR